MAGSASPHNAVLWANVPASSLQSGRKRSRKCGMTLGSSRDFLFLEINLVILTSQGISKIDMCAAGGRNALAVRANYLTWYTGKGGMGFIGRNEKFLATAPLLALFYGFHYVMPDKRQSLGFHKFPIIQTKRVKILTAVNIFTRFVTPSDYGNTLRTQGGRLFYLRRLISSRISWFFITFPYP